MKIENKIEKYLIRSEKIEDYDNLPVEVQEAIDAYWNAPQGNDDAELYNLEVIVESLNESGALVKTGGTALAKAGGKKRGGVAGTAAKVAGAYVAGRYAQKKIVKHIECRKKCKSKEGDAKKACMAQCKKANDRAKAQAKKK